MPIFEYICQDCHRRFEAVVRGAEAPVCPGCSSKKLEQQLSSFAVGGSHKSAASSVGPCGSCGDPRGPGACSMN
ncbi:MAG: zinc ribbon domain-containing protein [Acidobacteria bacterium]|nr:zinc ribbon domain-containing protein [Acidobacteriota bacterium]MBV9437095.1 zinc ribbon domain-containing protein [Acidobacteriota bacterium]